MDKVEARGITIGEARGVTIGMVVAYQKVGFSLEQIADEVGISVEEVQWILATLKTEGD